MRQQFKRCSIAVVSVLGVLAIGAGAFVYSGIYDIGADTPHTRPVRALVSTLVDRSIERRARDLVPPNLDDPQLVLEGAGHYAEMCTGCHLAPGLADNEMRAGLYPKPPQLAKYKPDPREAFWAIKHGIKMSAMPAWGASHDDAAIWGMVAFLQKLADMTPAQYQDIVARAPADHDAAGGHSHNHGGEHAHDSTGNGMAEGSDTAGHSHAAADGHEHEHAETAVETDALVSLQDLQPNAVPDAEAVARAFQSALQQGDRTAVLALLAPDVSIREGGHVQTRDAYASEHLGSDMAFLKDARITPISMASKATGATATVGSESAIETTSKGKPVTLRSQELLDLRQEAGTWKITAVHWQTAKESGK